MISLTCSHAKSKSHVPLEMTKIFNFSLILKQTNVNIEVYKQNFLFLIRICWATVSEACRTWWLLQLVTSFFNTTEDKKSNKVLSLGICSKIPETKKHPLKTGSFSCVKEKHNEISPNRGSAFTCRELSDQKRYSSFNSITQLWKLYVYLKASIHHEKISSGGVSAGKKSLGALNSK